MTTTRCCCCHCCCRCCSFHSSHAHPTRSKSNSKTNDSLQQQRKRHAPHQSMWPPKPRTFPSQLSHLSAHLHSGDGAGLCLHCGVEDSNQIEQLPQRHAAGGLVEEDEAAALSRDGWEASTRSGSSQSHVHDGHARQQKHRESMHGPHMISSAAAKQGRANAGEVREAATKKKGMQKDSASHGKR